MPAADPTPGTGDAGDGNAGVVQIHPPPAGTAEPSAELREARARMDRLEKRSSAAWGRWGGLGLATAWSASATTLSVLLLRDFREARKAYLDMQADEVEREARRDGVVAAVISDEIAMEQEKAGGIWEHRLECDVNDEAYEAIEVDAAMKITAAEGKSAWARAVGLSEEARAAALEAAEASWAAAAVARGDHLLATWMSGRPLEEEGAFSLRAAEELFVTRHLSASVRVVGLGLGTEARGVLHYWKWQRLFLRLLFSPTNKYK